MAKRKFYIPKQVLKRASRPGMNKTQISAYMTYIKDKAIQLEKEKKLQKRELTNKQAKALEMGRRVLAKKQVRQFFGRQGEVERGTGSGRAGQIVASAYKPKSKVSMRNVTIETARDYAREKEYLAAKKKIAYMEAKKKYYGTRSGKISSGVSKGFAFVRSPISTMAKWGYGNQMVSSGSRSGGGGGRGRPKGSLDRRYAAYGGVYGYRKAMAHQRAMEKLKARQQANLTPEQVMAIRAVRGRMANPENATYPDTSGFVDTSGYMNEIDNAAGAGDVAAGGIPD